MNCTPVMGVKRPNMKLFFKSLFTLLFFYCRIEWLLVSYQLLFNTFNWKRFKYRAKSIAFKVYIVVFVNAFIIKVWYGKYYVIAVLWWMRATQYWLPIVRFSEFQMHQLKLKNLKNQQNFEDYYFFYHC